MARSRTLRRHTTSIMSRYLPEFLTVAVLHLLAVMSPGPDFALVTRNSLLYSRRAGVYAAVGIALGILLHVTYCMVGIGLLIASSPLLFSLIKYAGAAYLIYIGGRSLLESATPAEVAVPARGTDITAPAALRSGFFTNALNPKASLFFLSLFSQVVQPATPTPLKLLYGVEMCIATFLWFAAVALVLSHPRLRARFAAAQVWIARGMGIVLIILGLRVAFAPSG
jgi:RhtB (resistance to homoserine/threonine) family protein